MRSDVAPPNVDLRLDNLFLLTIDEHREPAFRVLLDQRGFKLDKYEGVVKVSIRVDQYSYDVKRILLLRAIHKLLDVIDKVPIQLLHDFLGRALLPKEFGHPLDLRLDHRHCRDVSLLEGLDHADTVEPVILFLRSCQGVHQQYPVGIEGLFAGVEGDG